MANSSEDWMQKKWRPAMGWTYMAICLFDFILGPVLYNILQFYNPGQAVGMWTPLTLQGAGLFHLAMGAVLGIAAFGRTQEKVAGAASNIEPPKAPIPVAPILVASIPVAPIKKPQQEEPPAL
jgi:hypothetical protein